ncbi:MAG: hypothetical protein WCJ01_07315 [Ignavibacteria bacterium]
MNRTFHTIYIGLFYLTGITVTLILIVKGFGYYITPIEERFFNINHETLEPSGIIGHGLGITGSLMMVFGVAIYMIRKREMFFLRAGQLKHWLELHIFLCTVGPVLILFHTAFKFGGLVAISFWSMIAVVLSGVIGKFIYVQIPRSIQGKELDIQEMNEINEHLTIELKTRYNVSDEVLTKIEHLCSTTRYNKMAFVESIFVIFKDYFRTKRVLGQLKEEMKKTQGKNIHQLLKVIKSKIVLSRHIGQYRTMQKLFRYWHVAHLPFALVMFIIMVVHIVIAVYFGYKWIF